MNFYDWVLAQLPDSRRTAAEAARRIGVSESTVGRWRTGGIKMETVRQAVEALPGSNVLGGMIAAGLISEEEAGVTVVAGPPRKLTNEELVAEVGKRLGTDQQDAPLGRFSDKLREGSGEGDDRGVVRRRK